MSEASDKPKFEIIITVLKSGIHQRQEVVQMFECEWGDVRVLTLEHAEVRAKALFDLEVSLFRQRHKGTLVETVYWDQPGEPPHWLAVPVGIDEGIRVELRRAVQKAQNNA